MEPNAILCADPLDLLFENRNKSYGAYPLRKFYAQRLFISMGITFFTVGLCSFIYLHFYVSPIFTRVINIPDTYITPVTYPLPEKQILPPAKPAAPKQLATSPYSTPVITADQKVPDPMATVDELQKNAIGLKTSPGEGDNGGPNSNGNAGTGTGLQNSDSVETAPEVYRTAEVMPEFPGGIEALKRYLLKNLRMPENNLEPGEKIRVIARFIVGADGRVRDIEITQAAEAVFNAEVKRVISKMPDWKPGSQNHRNVAVYFSLPVNFVNAE